MCRRVTGQVVSMLGVVSVLFGDSVLGFVLDVGLARLGMCCVPARLVMIEITTTCVLGQCDWSALARGFYFCMIKW
jgi:hypothetical protein